MQPVFPIKLAAVSCALTCAGMIAAIISRQTGNNAPLPGAIDPSPPFTVSVRTVSIRLPKSVRFEDRWLAAPPVVAPPPAPTVNATDSKPDHRVLPSFKKRDRDRVCGNRGQRYFHKGRRLSWRCRR